MAWTYGLDLKQFARLAFRLTQSCPALSNHNFLELLAVFSGKKRVARFVLTDETYDSLKEFYAQTHLIQGISAKKQAPVQKDPLGDTFTVSVDWDDPRGKYFVMIVGQKPAEVQRALAFENEGVSSWDFGKLYEYPLCCVEAYRDLEQGEEWISAYLRRSPINVPGYFQANRLAELFEGYTLIPDYFSCCLSCQPTREIGWQYASILSGIGWNDYLRQTETSLLAPILIRDGTLLQLRDAEQSQNVIRYDVSRVCQINWRGSLASDDLFWQSDSIVISGNRLKLIATGRVITDEPIALEENRLLTFN